MISWVLLSQVVVYIKSWRERESCMNDVGSVTNIFRTGLALWMDGYLGMVLHGCCFIWLVVWYGYKWIISDFSVYLHVCWWLFFLWWNSEFYRDWSLYLTHWRKLHNNWQLAAQLQDMNLWKGWRLSIQVQYNRQHRTQPREACFIQITTSRKELRFPPTLNCIGLG